ncbi:hypothetical protein O7626_17790 [Micromonospora sp. WMMD1102]|uniref:hypothetical protein n=1 Tax=Micromonospora sp. WMMD1102 TaxID=3016105 RepID=UPI0024154E73|nr:hypothetical protein [Micromonospora sp. WMMD1102]MDG4787767.1 hypothetical protein [Micromonospora sp. WMMD1102]
MHLKRVAVGVAVTAMATLGIATAAAAPASAAYQAPEAVASAVLTSDGDVSIAGENYVQCSYSYWDCVHTRSNFARYYAVSPIYQYHEGCTLPGGCPELVYYFYYYN